MDKFIERTLRIEGHSLDGWGLREIDAQGNPVADAWSWWNWSVRFTSSPLRRSYMLEAERDHEEVLEEIRARNRGGVVGDTAPVRMVRKRSERLHAQLQPDDITIGPFGTARQFQRITLTIDPLPEADDTHATCQVWGTLQYTYELDFLTETQDDLLSISVQVPRADFDAMCDLIATEPGMTCDVTLSGANGFYSHWSPGISTSAIKVLTPEDHLKIADPDGIGVVPSRVGSVGDFRLMLVQSERKPEEPPAPPPPPPAPAPLPPPPAMPNLKAPLWIAVVLLGLLLFK